ncbi:MAG: GNAT family N-acetyltransferase [Ktedonobacteraceae bacterium]
MLTAFLPRGFVLRRPTMSDIEGVLQLIQTCEIEREGRPESTLDSMRLWWQSPDFSLATDSWIVLSPEEKAIAFASVEHRQHARIFVGGDVHPKYQGRGIGTHLLQLNTERAYQHIAEAPSDARVSMLSWEDEKNIAARHLLEKHDFKQIRSFWRMKIELHEAPPVPKWAYGITVRALADDPSLFRAVFEADEDAFQDHWGHTPMKFEEWEHWTSKREHYDPSLWFLAMDGNEIAAVSLCEDEKELGGWVHSLGVRRQWRRKGIGEALLYQSFGEFYKRGIHEVYLGVDAASLTGATRLYERVGMHIHRRSDTYEKEIRAGREISTQSVET